MTDNLNDKDKERIYKEVNRIFNESESVDLVHELMFKVGEYEHNYQREQQAMLKESLNKIAYRLYKTDYKYISLDPCKVEVLEIYINQLEAERSELKNKVIELEKENKTLKGILKNELLDDNN